MYPLMLFDDFMLSGEDYETLLSGPCRISMIFLYILRSLPDLLSCSLLRSGPLYP